MPLIYQTDSMRREMYEIKEQLYLDDAGQIYDPEKEGGYRSGYQLGAGDVISLEEADRLGLRAEKPTNNRAETPKNNRGRPRKS